MSADSRSDHFFVYPKNKDGSYTGHSICVLLRDGRMFHGEALCGPQDQFQKSVGRKLSLERAMFEYERDAKHRECPAVQEALDSVQDNYEVDKDDYGSEYMEPEAPVKEKKSLSKDTWILSYGSNSKHLYKIEHYQEQDGDRVNKGILVKAHKDDKGWTAKAKENPLMDLLDHGNGVVIDNVTNQTLRLSYSAFQDIGILYKLWKKYEKQSEKFKRLK